MSKSPRPTEKAKCVAPWPGLALAAVAVLSLGPLLLESRPTAFVPPHTSLLLRLGSKLLVVLAAIWAIVLCSWYEGRTASRRNLALAFLAALLAGWHLYAVDTRRTEVNPAVPVEAWQRTLYLDILDGWEQITLPTRSPVETLQIPHVYRSLPYGFVRGLERLTGDWRFSCLVYRWFFTFWLLWASFQFVRLFHDSARAWLGIAILVVLYPLSVMYYWGQLTDPMSHAFFVLTLLWIVQDRWVLVLAAVALGVMAKETAVVLVPGYLACHWRRGWPTLWRTAAIGLACVAAYLAVRLPVGWAPGLSSPGGTIGLMIGTNLGIGRPLYHGAAPVSQNYLHVFLFVGIFLPMILRHWRQADRRLRRLSLVVVPLVLLSSVCFSWLYESRNYVPLLPLLAALSLTPRHQPGASGESTS